MKLRDYQQQAINGLWQYYRDRKGDGQTHNVLLVAPTGAGKSVLIAAIVRDMLEKFGGMRVLILTHQRELIQQNFEKLVLMYPASCPGVYSASLGKKQTHNKVIFAGIQSVHDKAHKLGQFSLILIDEAHTLPKTGAGMYRRFITDINRICGKVPVIGLTATPYRLDSGHLHKGEGALFTDVAVDIPINQLLDGGYLSPLTTKQVGFTIDVTGVKKRGGEFIAEQLAEAADAVTINAIKDALPRIENRKTGLVFCVTVAHAEHVADELNRRGVSCAVVSGITPKGERDRLLAQLRDGKIRCLANVNCLTTGVDVPNIDFLIMLRPTQSPGLYVQMAGRGMRLAECKFDCLVLDYAGNIQRHGPIDAINIRDKKQSDGDGEAPVKVCPDCESIVHASLRTCPCGYEFPPPSLKIDNKASKSAVLSRDYEPEWRMVSRCSYSRHLGKDGKPDTMRVDYWDDGGLFPVRVASEFICVFHPLGYARMQASIWLEKRGMTVDDANSLIDGTAELEPWHTEAILLDTRGKYAKIVGYQLDKEIARDAA